MHPDVHVRVGKGHSDKNPELVVPIDALDVMLLFEHSDPPHTANQLLFVVMEDTHKLFDPMFQDVLLFGAGLLFWENISLFLSITFCMFTSSISFLLFPSHHPMFPSSPPVITHCDPGEPSLSEIDFTTCK